MRKKMMKFISLASLALLATVAGCTIGGKENSDPVKENELVIVMMEAPAASVQFKINTIQKYARIFENENPGVTIKIEKVPIQTYALSTLERLEKKQATDLIFTSYSSRLVEANVFADLLPFYKADRMATDDIYKSLLDIVTIDGTMLGIPMSPQPLAVLYNKRWFDKAGLNYPQSGWTWDEYFDLSTKLLPANQVEGREMHGSLIPLDLPFFETLARSSGTSILSSNATTARGYLDSRSVAEAINMVMHHVKNTHSTKPSRSSANDTYLEMSSNNVGMGIGQFTVYTFLDGHTMTQGQIGVAPLPRLENGIRANTVYIDMLSIASASKNKQLAWKFLRDVILNADSSFHQDWADQEFLTNKTATQKLGIHLHPELKVFIDELEVAVKPVVYTNQDINNIIVEGFTSKLNSANTVDEVQAALTEAAIQIDEKLKKMK